MDNKIFGYTLSDAWGAPILGTNVYDREKDNVECTIWALSNFSTERPEAKRYTVPMSVIQQINELLLESSDIFGFEEVESPFVIDGVINDFYFSCAGEETALMAFNIWAFLDEEKDIRGNRPEKALKILDIFNGIKQLLTEQGIDSKYLQLDL